VDTRTSGITIKPSETIKAKPSNNSKLSNACTEAAAAGLVHFVEDEGDQNRHGKKCSVAKMNPYPMVKYPFEGPLDYGKNSGDHQPSQNICD
jgi:hypothetical protein